MIVERSYHFKAGGSVVFALDASDGGAPRLPEAFELLRQLARILPNFRDHRVMFLGGTQSYSAADLEKKWRGWLQENAGRLSILAPLYDTLANSTAIIVVLAGYRLFDLDDWRDTPQFQQTVFVGLGEVMLDDGVRSHPPDADELSNLICRSPIRIEIGGPGLIPTYWDNPAFTPNDRLQLQFEGGEHSVDCNAVLAFAGPSESKLVATATFENGVSQDWLLPEAMLPADLDNWAELPPVEAMIIRECLERQEYTCPYCLGCHPADDLNCGALGLHAQETVLPSLSEQGELGIVLLRMCGDRVEFRPQVSAALRLGREVVALKLATNTHVYRFDSARKEWLVEAGEFRQFQPIPGCDAYAIIL